MPDKQDEMIKLLRSIEGNTGYIGYISTDDLGTKLDDVNDHLSTIEDLLRDIRNALDRED